MVNVVWMLYPTWLVGASPCYLDTTLSIVLSNPIKNDVHEQDLFLKKMNSRWQERHLFLRPMLFLDALTLQECDWAWEVLFYQHCISAPRATKLNGREALGSDCTSSAKLGDCQIARAITYGLAKMLFIFQFAWSYANSVSSHNPALFKLLQKACHNDMN